MKTNFNFGLQSKVLKGNLYVSMAIICLSLIWNSTTTAQAKDDILNGTLLRCNTDLAMQSRFAKDPELQEKFQELQDKEQEQDLESRISCNAGNTIMVPLAFHFDATFLCSDEACILSEIDDAIAALNIDFASNIGSPNAANCSTAYPDISTGTCITFYLAQPPTCSGLDPACDGSITVGQFVGGYSAGGAGAGACWDDYLNVFVVSEALGLLGVSDQVPGIMPAIGPGEGVTLAGSTFGGPDGPCGILDSDNTYNLGKTLSHEIGHYLGLFHTFENSCSDEPNNSFNGINISVDDTQPQDTPFFGCPTDCFDSDCGGPQQTANIMNYTDDACMDLFTEDQAFAMNTVANGLFSGLNIPAASPTQLCTCEPGGGAGYTITDGSASWSYPGEITGISCDGNVNFDPGNGINQSFAADWYYALNGSPSVGFPNIDPANVTQTPNSIRVAYPDLGGVTGLTAVLSVIITEDAALDVQLAQLMEIENNSTTLVDVKVFNYLDLDKNENTVQNVNLFLQDACNIITEIIASNDPSQVCYFAVNAADGFQIEPYSTLCDDLTAGISNLTNTGLPLLSADYTQAYQFDGSLNVGESFTGETILTFGSPPEPAVFDPVSGQCTFPSTPNPSDGFITCPADQNVACGLDAIAGMITIDTICSVFDFVIDVTGPVIQGTPDCPGTSYTYTFIASDLCDNIDTCFQVFTIVNDGPSFMTCPMDETVSCADEIVTNPPGYMTSCSLGASVDVQGPQIIGDEDCPSSIYTYTYIVTDVCGRSDTCIQNFTIMNDGPEITQCPTDMDVACANEIVLGVPIYTTSCDVGASLINEAAVVNGTPNCPGTTYSFTMRITDTCGRESTCEQVFTIVNDSPRFMTCPMDETVSCADEIVTNPPDYMTSCLLGASVDVQGPEITGDEDCPGSIYTYSYIVTDVCGRSDTCIQNFTISNEGPNIDDCPIDQTVTCASDIIQGIPGYTTSCSLGASVDVQGPEITGDEDCPGTVYTYTYIVTDICGGSDTCTQNFTIGVGAAPEITQCPADMDVACANEIVIGVPMYTTSCGVGANVINEAPLVNGTANCPGTTYSYTMRITDACGRESTCQQVFTIVNEGPVIDCLDNLTISCENEISATIPTYTTSCGSAASITKTGPVVQGDPHCDGTTYTYTYTVLDACGRSTSCNQVFTIDNTCQRLDFDAYPPATIISNQYPGVSISTQDNHYKPAMLFNTANPTGNDYDLGTPNELYGGPGIGSGYGNDAYQGNALIISKDQHVPNETEGMLIFDFDCTSFIRSIDFLDMECGHNTITLYDFDHDVIDVITIPQYGENSFHVEHINQGGVYQMVIDFPCAGGGITDIKYCEDMTPGAMCGVCDEATLDFAGQGVDWITDGTTGSYTVGYQAIDIDIADPDGIFVDSHEDLSGLEIGIDPNDVNDLLSIVYDLTEVASFVQFDIEDLDYKDGVSKQQESVCVCGFLAGDPTPIYPVITSLDGSVHINGNCAEATQNSSVSYDDESVLVTFEDCIDQVVIKYGSGPNTPTNHPTYSKMIIGKRFGFTTRSCPDACSDCALFGDVDGDGICDDCDICLSGDDTVDSDGNGIPDACDGDCASLGDSDFDGVCDPNDICPGGNDNIDLDGNGVPDACEACHEYKLVLGCTNEWTTDDQVNQYTVSEQIFDINIMDMDNILEDTQQERFGLNVGIDPHDTDDVVLIKYNLSEVANHVMFDIHDLDYKDGNSKQQEAVCIYGYLDTIPVMVLPIITSLNGSVSINGNCAEGTTNSSSSGDDESIMVVFDECIDQIVIEYGTGSNSPTNNPSYSNITIGFDLGFKTEVCVDKCLPACQEMVQLVGPAMEPHYQASQDIESTQMVDGSSVIYDAGNSVLMKNGFQVMDGTVFSAQIGGCIEN